MIFRLVKKKCLCLQLLTEDMPEPPLLFITLIFMRRAAGPAVASPLSICGSVGRMRGGAKAERLGAWFPPSAGEAKPLPCWCWGALPERDGLYGLPCLPHAASGAATAWEAGSLLGSPTQAVPSGSPPAPARFRVGTVLAGPIADKTVPGGQRMQW